MSEHPPKKDPQKELEELLLAEQKIREDEEELERSKSVLSGVSSGSAQGQLKKEEKSSQQEPIKKEEKGKEKKASGTYYREVKDGGKVVLRLGDILPPEKVLLGGAMAGAQVRITGIRSLPQENGDFSLDLEVTTPDGVITPLSGVRSDSPKLALGLNETARGASRMKESHVKEVIEKMPKPTLVQPVQETPVAAETPAPVAEEIPEVGETPAVMPVAPEALAGSPEAMIAKYEALLEEREELAGKSRNGDAFAREKLIKIDALLNAIEIDAGELTERLENKNSLKWFTSDTLVPKVKEAIRLDNGNITDADFTSQDLAVFEPSENEKDTIALYTVNGFVVMLENKSDEIGIGHPDARYTVFGPNGKPLESELVLESAEMLAKEKGLEYQKKVEGNYKKIAKKTDGIKKWNEEAIKRITGHLAEEIAKYEQGEVTETPKKKVLEAADTLEADKQKFDALLLEKMAIDAELAETDKLIAELTAELAKLKVLMDSVKETKTEQETASGGTIGERRHRMAQKLEAGPTFYMGTPLVLNAQETIFTSNSYSAEYKEGHVLYKFYPSVDGKEAEFEFVSDDATIKMIQANSLEVVRPACELMDTPSEETTKVLTVSKGTSVFENNQWKVVKKAKITFV